MKRNPVVGNPGPNGKTVAVYLSNEQAEMLTKTAMAQHTSVSELIRRMIRYYFLPLNVNASSHEREAS